MGSWCSWRTSFNSLLYFPWLAELDWIFCCCCSSRWRRRNSVKDMISVCLSRWISRSISSSSLMIAGTLTPNCEPKRAISSRQRRKFFSFFLRIKSSDSNIRTSRTPTTRRDHLINWETLSRALNVCARASVRYLQFSKLEMWLGETNFKEYALRAALFTLFACWQRSTPFSRQRVEDVERENTRLGAQCTIWDIEHRFYADSCYWEIWSELKPFNGLYKRIDRNLWGGWHVWSVCRVIESLACIGDQRIRKPQVPSDLQ